MVDGQQGLSERHIFELLDVPRSTIQHWLDRKDHIDEDPQLVDFFESPVGVAFMHRLVLAAQFVITMVGPCGIRLVSLYLELTGLNQFVAASYGAQQKVSSQMEKAIAEFGEEECERLALGMAPKKVTICEDETFHPETCLVSMEPVSNYIFLEKYAPNRTAEEWTNSLNEALADLPVEVVQCASDEGKGIIHHVEKDIGAHHSPDVFHVQNEVVKGTSFPLATKKTKAEKEVEKAEKEVKKKTGEKEAYFSCRQKPGRPPEFDKQIEAAKEEEAEAKILLEKAQCHQEDAKDAIRGISKEYHPYDIETGKPKSAEEVSSALEQRFAKIENIASEAQLPERCTKRVEKAKRVVPNMVATIAFFFLSVRAKVEAFCLAPEIEQVVYNDIIPGIYLALASEKAKNSDERRQLREKSDVLLGRILTESSPLNSLDNADRSDVWSVAEECAQLFQRSSSCVEGRNGQLALRHHGFHRIREGKLAALTAVHNYFIKRSDGSTAAERLFGAKPRDMFEYLLGRVDLPGRPAKKRPKKMTMKYQRLKAAI